MNPKPNKKIVLKSRVLRNNCLEGLFHTVPSSVVLHCRYIEAANLDLSSHLPVFRP